MSGQSSGPDGAISSLHQQMAGRCLPAPPVPSTVAPVITRQGPLAWGTEAFDPLDQYLHHDHVERLVAEVGGGPLWLFGHAGHGINSYAWSLSLRLGPLVLAVQGLWVDWLVYNRPAHDAAQLARLFQTARLLLAATGDLPGPARVLVDVSTFRDTCRVVDLAGGDEQRCASVEEAGEAAASLLGTAPDGTLS